MSRQSKKNVGLNLTKEQRIFLVDDNCVLQELTEWKGYSPTNSTPDELIEWIAEYLPLELAQKVLSELGSARAYELYSPHRISDEEWALASPYVWSSHEHGRSFTLSDYIIYEPPTFDPSSVPVLATRWWEKNIAKPQEPNPRRRCGYLVAAGFLKENFSEDDLIRFVASQISLTTGQEYYPGWELTPEGWARLEVLESGSNLNSKTKTQTERKLKFRPEDFKSIPDLAKKYKITTYRKAFAKRLERWGNDNPEGVETRMREGRPKNEPYQFYHEPSVRNICEEYADKG